MQVYRNDLRKYLKFKDEMQTGDVIAFKGNDFGSKAILVGTNSNYSHVGMVVRINSSSITRLFIVEAVPIGGVILQAISYKLIYFSGEAWWAKLKYTSQENRVQVRDRILDWSLRQLGKPYDTDLIGGIIAKILFKTKLPRDSQYEFICSELVAAALKNIGALKKSETSLTPKQIMELDCLESPVKLI
jgi:uncharacterized protein YycO